MNASFQHGIHLFRDARIQPGHRFIQYQHLAARRQCPRQKHSLLLSARQFAECMILPCGKGKETEHMLCVIPIHFSVPIRKGKLTQPAGQYDLPHTGRKILFHGLLLRQVAHPLLRVRQMETDLT